MKSLLLSLAFVSSFLLLNKFASATLPMPPQAVTVAASIRGMWMDLRTVDLLTDGHLMLTDKNGTTMTVDLSETVAKLMIAKAQRLSTAPATVEERSTICPLMPPDDLSELYVANYETATGKFTGKPHFVLSDEGCWVAHYATPNDRWSLVLAADLRGQMMILALASLP